MDMKAQIANFRQSRHTVKGNHMIITIDGVDKREDAEKLVGKTVTWKSPANNEIAGKVASAHGNSGAIRVIFDKGMPGQSIGNEVAIQ